MGESLIAITEGSGKNVSTYSLTIGGNTVEIERSMMGIGMITLPGTPQANEVAATGLTPASAIDVQGRFYIVCKNTFNDDAASASYRIAFYDSASVLIGYSEVITIENLGIADGARYVGSNVIYSNDFGAKEIKFYIVSISASDNISISVGVV